MNYNVEKLTLPLHIQLIKCIQGKKISVHFINISEFYFRGGEIYNYVEGDLIKECVIFIKFCAC